MTYHHCLVSPCPVCHPPIQYPLFVQRPELIVKENFVSHAGLELDFKIECDALSFNEIGTCAYLLSKRVKPFCGVLGIPRGGLLLAKAMEQYIDPKSEYTLIVDDVYTTGKSFNDFSQDVKGKMIGAAIFARKKPPDGVTALFELTPERNT